MLYNAPTGSTDPNAPYVGKNVPGGVQGSKVPPKAVEMPQREIVNTIAASGQTPTNDDSYQLLRAVRGGKLEYYVDSSTTPGTASIAPAPAHTSLFDGLHIREKMALPCTGPTSQIVNALSAPIKRRGFVQLVGGEWAAGDILDLTYSSAAGAFQICGLTASDVTAAMNANPPKNVLLNQFVFTANGTYNATPGTRYIEVEGVAPGGGSGGCAASPSLAYQSVAGGGQGGSFCVARFTTGFTGGIAVNVGTGGTAGATGANSGGNGSAATFGSLISLPGGLGSPGGQAIYANNASGAQTQGGFSNLFPTITGASLVLKSAPGAPGSTGIALNGGGNIYGGQGGASPFGSGPAPTAGGGAGVSNAAVAATIPGTGAAGGSNNGSANTNIAGAVGAAGAFIVREYA